MIRISCIVPSPGFSEQNGTVAVLAVQPLHPGLFTLRFTSETAVLANDGLGTNVLRKTVNGSYHVDGDVGSPATHHDLTIFSSTHPNSERWYASSVIKADWRRNATSVYHYALNAQEDYIVSDDDAESTGPLTLEAPGDEVYYLHVQETHEDLTTATDRYTIRIDTTPPPPPTIDLSDDDVRAGSIVRTRLENSDTADSFQPGYFIQINDGVLLPVLSPVYLPFMAAGDYTIKVRIFDTAGNVSDTTRVVHVRR